ncbi:alpha/beta hydrolase [Mycolicibacterium canariasense]|uniref:alpha/beta hydrolase n=1 Tax=Mycolicibacterium canariasense TaxID=228230 RepID=UPI0009FE503F|nr:alpha/beta hydrolase [Mycolicibacterium canariasense]MCV7209874.1 alpha/beta hydrolase [Mycolicibacterium canariasense]
MTGSTVAPISWCRTWVWPGSRIVRALFESRRSVTPPPTIAEIRKRVTVWPTVAITAELAPAARLSIYSPVGADACAVVLWVHGGGFIANSAAGVADFAAMIADQGYVVACLDYTLAPGARYPVPIIQGNAALAYIASHIASYGGDPTRIFLGGDSAGAQIASQLAAMQTNPTLARRVSIHPALRNGQLLGVVLYCGFYDMCTVKSSGFPALRTCLWAYTGHHDWLRAPFIDELSTAQHLTHNFPPAFITVGDDDPFEGQSKEFAEALAAHGVRADTLFWTGSGAGLGHEYQFDYRLPQAQAALRPTLKYLESNASPPCQSTGA